MPDPMDFDDLLYDPWPPRPRRDGPQVRMTPEGIIGNGARSAFERITRAPLSDGQVGAGVFGVPVRLAKIAEVTYPGRSDEDTRRVRRVADAIDAHVQGIYLAQEAALWAEARARPVAQDGGVMHYFSDRGRQIAEAVTPLYAATVAEHNDRVSLAQLARMGPSVVVRALTRDGNAREALRRLQGMVLDKAGAAHIDDAASSALYLGWISRADYDAVRGMVRARMTA